MQNKYLLKDASNVYILAIIVPIIVSFILSFVLGFIATFFNIKTDALLSNIWVYAILLLFSQGSFLAVVLFYNKVKKIKTAQATALNNRINFLQIVLVLIVSVSSLFLFLPLVNMFDALIRLVGYSNSGSLPFAINNWWSLIVGLLVLALLPAICEEMVFRGVLYNGFKNSLGTKKAIIFSALCFCIMHMSLQQTVYPLILGIVLALIVYYTGSVKASILAHFFNNAIVILSNFIASFSEQTQETATFVFNVQNILSAIICAVIGVAIVILCCELLKRINNNKQQHKITEDAEVQQTEEISSDETVNEKADMKVFYTYLAISIALWIFQNILYF